MRFILFFFFLTSTALSTLAQHRSAIQLIPLKDKEVVKYTTTEATLSFGKSDLITAFESERDTPNTDKEVSAFEFLKKTSKRVNLIEQDTSVSDNDKLLAQVIRNKLAVSLLIRGQVEILRTSDKKIQKNIFYETESTSADAIDYHFIFNNGQPFFTGHEAVGITPVSEEVFAPREEPDENRIFTIVEQQPEPVISFSAFADYLSKKLRYPEKAKADKLEGSCFIEFVVQIDGSLTDFRVIKGLSVECDQEAIRLVREGGDWKPGKQNGKVKKVRFVLPVKFKLA